MLCGSCWAISVAGIVADNFVISGIVDWIPNISTTWALMCNKQLQCGGGNPALLLEYISQYGIVSNHCVDYSWCTENPKCSGEATKHFETNAKVLSDLIPTSVDQICGCYNDDVKFHVYYTNAPEAVSMGLGGLHGITFTNTIKKHIAYNGPVQGGFIVFKNFMDGGFSKINGGVYLEKGVYKNGTIKFDDKQIDPSNYGGSHAVSIIGWGIQEGVIIDNNGNKESVPYWYCMNSWSDRWADGGYFKMAMYPYNKIAQFDKLVTINTPKGFVRAGGMVMINVTEKPKLRKLGKIKEQYQSMHRSEPDSYYTTDYKNKDEDNDYEDETVNIVEEEDGEEKILIDEDNTDDAKKTEVSECVCPEPPSCPVLGTGTGSSTGGAGATNKCTECKMCDECPHCPQAPSLFGVRNIGILLILFLSIITVIVGIILLYQKYLLKTHNQNIK